MLRAIQNIFKSYFVAGILFLAPVFITFYIVKSIIVWADEALETHRWFPFDIPGLGILIALIVILIAGFLGKNFLGRFIFSSTGDLLSKIPFLGAVYSSTQQIFETFLGGRTKQFGRVVLVNYPHSQSWVLAMVTSESVVGEIQKASKDPLIGVFVPTAPNPTSGFHMYVPRSQTVETQIKVDTAFKIILSIGLISPDSPVKKV